MTNELKQELLKAHIYGHTNEQIAAVTGLTAEEVAQTIADNAEELAEKRAHISTMATTPLGTENALSTVKAAVGGKVYFGIDVSVWNGYVDWKAVKAAGKSFAFIRSGYGNTAAYPRQVDSRFAQNVRNARAAGVEFGVYHYCYALTAAAAKAEAEAFVKQLNKIKPIPHLVLLDIEENAQTKLPAEQGRALVKAFMDVVEKAGYYGAIYTFDSYAQKLGSDFCKKYVRWIANISRTPSAPYDGWQYSWTGKVSGCSGDVDLDKTAIDYPAKIKAAGKNGYKKPNEKNALDTKGFKRGDKGLGVYALKCRLMALGYKMSDDQGFGAGTEKAVNSLLKKWGYRENGIAGDKFLKIVMK
jgi:GH25 family lysozyme M1 (1,4-beta-N-acetylmuramidase)